MWSLDFPCAKTLASGCQKLRFEIVRRSVLSVGSALVLIACNVLSGAGDLEICSGATCGSGSSSTSSSSGSPPDDAGTEGAVAPLCEEAEKTCNGRMLATCTGATWKETSCPETCVDGACAPWPSCRNAAGAACGKAGTSCCETKAVPGGTFLRRNDDEYPATVSAFDLDVYEVTVARFRAFVDAGGGVQAQPPAVGAGAHPKIPDSGWNEGWNALLPPSSADLREFLAGGTWTDTAGTNEKKPITNVSWFDAFAFCIWDGGRLPTYAEWNFAAAGGDEQRYYPWSSPAQSSEITAAHAVYECTFSEPAYTCPPAYCSVGDTTPCDPTACSTAGGTCVTPSCYGCDLAKDLGPTGAASAGAGRWGHLDLAGNVGEMLLESYTEKSGPGGGNPLLLPCVDCAGVMPADPRGSGIGPLGKKDSEFFLAGGAWNDSAPGVRSAAFSRRRWDYRSTGVGFRCARD